MSALTILTLVPNAADRIERCLESVAWADERFCVVDPNTTDGSDELAQRHATRVETHAYANKADQCNWAIPQIKTEWTLVLDADEWVAPELAERIREVIACPASADAFKIRRLSYFFGKLIEHCGWDRDYNLRLFRTAQGRYRRQRVHSTVEVEGRVGRIDEPMYHDDKRDFAEYFATFQRFTSWAAEDMLEKGRLCRATDLTARPVLRFLKQYVLRQGFRDGRHGLVLCGLSAFSVFTKYAKLWDLHRQASDATKE